nr:MAG TPA: hypothetical protein [Caudoviricetes sp.]
MFRIHLRAPLYIFIYKIFCLRVCVTRVYNPRIMYAMYVTLSIFYLFLYSI